MTPVTDTLRRLSHDSVTDNTPPSRGVSVTCQRSRRVVVAGAMCSLGRAARPPSRVKGRPALLRRLRGLGVAAHRFGRWRCPAMTHSRRARLCDPDLALQRIRQRQRLGPRRGAPALVVQRKRTFRTNRVWRTTCRNATDSGPFGAARRAETARPLCGSCGGTGRVARIHAWRAASL